MTSRPDENFIDIGENYLEHFGKMGMSWGRRSSNTDGGIEVHIHERSHHGGLAALAVLAVAGVLLASKLPPEAKKPILDRKTFEKIFDTGISAGVVIGKTIP